MARTHKTRSLPTFCLETINECRHTTQHTICSLFFYKQYTIRPIRRLQPHHILEPYFFKNTELYWSSVFKQWWRCLQNISPSRSPRDETCHNVFTKCPDCFRPPHERKTAFICHLVYHASWRCPCWTLKEASTLPCAPAEMRKMSFLSSEQLKRALKRCVRVSCTAQLSARSLQSIHSLFRSPLNGGSSRGKTVRLNVSIRHHLLYHGCSFEMALGFYCHFFHVVCV